MEAFVLRFAVDFLRLRRELRDADHLTTCMETHQPGLDPNKARDLSRLNNRLYECVPSRGSQTETRSSGFRM